MFELGNVQNHGYYQHPTYTEQNRITNLQKTANTQQGGQNTNSILSSENSQQVTSTGFREKATAFRLLADEIINSNSLSKNIAKNLKAHIEEIMKAAEGSIHIIYSDIGEMLEKIRKEIQSINSLEGFLFGVRDKIEEYTRYTEFSLRQFLEMEQKTAQQNGISKLITFSLNQIETEDQKALQCQANINPDKALRLLTN